MNLLNIPDLSDVRIDTSDEKTPHLQWVYANGWENRTGGIRFSSEKQERENEMHKKTRDIIDKTFPYSYKEILLKIKKLENA